MGERVKEEAKLHQVYILVTWDEDRDDEGNVRDVLPLVRSYEDKDDAMGAYRWAVTMRDHAYLYVTDEMGNWKIILELD